MLPLRKIYFCGRLWAPIILQYKINAISITVIETWRWAETRTRSVYPSAGHRFPHFFSRSRDTRPSCAVVAAAATPSEPWTVVRGTSTLQQNNSPRQPEVRAHGTAGTGVGWRRFWPGQRTQKPVLLTHDRLHDVDNSLIIHHLHTANRSNRNSARDGKNVGEYWVAQPKH